MSRYDADPAAANRQVLWEWQGQVGDIAPGYDQLAGTGQSGSSATTATRNRMIEHALGLSVHQQTSSGSGSTMTRIFLPAWIEHTRFAFGMTYLVPTADADVDSLNIGVGFNRDDDSKAGKVRIKSGFGVTNQVQYYNSSAGWTDTGLTWVGSASSGTVLWRTVEVAVDLTSEEYMWIQAGDEYMITTPDIYAPGAVSIAPSCELQIQLEGDDTASYCYIDKMWVHALNGS